jgi:signal transduction histidine kinase
MGRDENPMSGDHCQILVVDDEENVRLMLEQLLVEAGHEVVVAASAQQAMAAFEGRRFDIVLTDLRMPDTDGIALADWVRRTHPGTDVILMTGYASVETAIESVRLGAFDYLLKPFPDLEMVTSAVERVITKRQLEAALERANEELRVSRRSFASIVERTTEGILVTDSQGNVYYANPAAERLLGLAPGEPGRVDFPIAADAVREIEIPLESSGRGKAEIRVDATDWEGKPAYLISVRDITERKRLQAQMAQNDRLASVGLLAAGVAHEINNPLTYVLINLESLVSALPEAAHEVTACANDALQGVNRVRDIIRGLKTFSRVDEDRREPVHLYSVIECATSMAYNEIKYRARLVKEYGRTPKVMANDGRLSQVFLNLLINAAHAIEEGNVDDNEIRVRTWTEGEEVLAEVSDTGKGIPQENLCHLFEPFFTTKETGVGTGLGLYICHNIVRSYGGRIDVESEPGGGGTRFVVRLPTKSERSAEASTPGTSRPATKEPAESPVRGRVLVVDDDPIVRSALKRMLGREHELVVVGSGAEGKRVLEEDSGFDLILCDLIMPEVTGMDLHSWLTEVLPEIAERMVFVTAGAFTSSARAFVARVDNLVVEKPFDTEAFRVMVRDRIKQ